LWPSAVIPNSGCIKKEPSVATENQVQANRANAQKSTGPRTAEGKTAVRHNAVTHGLLVSEVVIPDGAAKENREEYEALYAGMCKSYEAANLMEAILVQKMTDAVWRSRRAHRHEGGLLRRNRDDVESHLREAIRQEFRTDVQYLHSSLESADHDVNILSRPESFSTTRELANADARKRLRKNPLGVRYLLETVTGAIHQVQTAHKMDAVMQQRLHLEFAGPDPSLPVSIFRVAQGKARRNELSADDRGAVLDLLAAEKVSLQALLIQVEQRHDEIEAAAVAEASVPNEPAMEIGQRYESMRDRQFNQAFLQLERMQRRRKETTPSPTLDVHVTAEH
jgi:hypothetical protein